ncbi:hypothetical protein BH10PSE18_BH10PSE18_18810 [soil metagenome]
MTTELVPMELVAQERAAEISALTLELAAFLNARRPDKSLALIALLNTYVIAAESFGMLNEAIPVMAANASSLAAMHGISLDVAIPASVH